MKIFKFVFLFIIIAIVGGLGILAFIDIPVQQTPVTKVIPDERLLSE